MGRSPPARLPLALAGGTRAGSIGEPREHGEAADDLERARRWGAASGIGIALRASALVGGGDAQVGLLGTPSRPWSDRPPSSNTRVRSPTSERPSALEPRADARRVLEGALRSRGAAGSAARCPTARASSCARREAGRATRTATAAGQLTASELRVAELAALGQSNPEIAQALFVTRKTVETHLGHVYSKLGISGRGELEARWAPSRVQGRRFGELPEVAGRQSARTFGEWLTNAPAGTPCTCSASGCS